MEIALVSAPFSRQMPPSIPSVKLAYWYGALKPHDVKTSVYDLNSDLFLALNFKDEAYNILHHFFGGLVYIPLKYLPSHEFYFDTSTALPLLLTLVYAEKGDVSRFVEEKSRDFGIEYNLLLSWVDKALGILDDFSKKVAQNDVIFVDMPMPGASTTGLLLCASIRERNPDAIIVASGNHINIPELAVLGFSMNAYDYIAFWDDEYAVDAFVTHFERGDIKNVPNIAWKQNNTLERSEKVICDKNLDMLPMPDFSPFHFPRYKIGTLAARAVLIETARSCPFRCNYCSFRKFWNCLGEVNEVYRSKSIDRVMKEIEAAQTTYPINCVSFGDRTLNFNGKSRFETLLSQLRGRDLIYAGAMRADLLTDSIIEKMAEAGFVSVVLGVESFDSSCVRSYEKGSSGYVENAVEVAVRLLENGIMPHINILVGHPHESCEDTMRALNQLEKVTDYIKGRGYPVSGLNASVFHFNYPSKMYNEFLESGDFEVFYHEVEVDVPAEVKKAAEKIPLKAVKKVREATSGTIDKCTVSDKIYTFWSDDEAIIAYTLRTLEPHFESLFSSWMHENVILQWEGSLLLESAASAPEQVVKEIIEADRLSIRELVEKLGYNPENIPKDIQKMVWAVIFMLYSKRVLNVLPPEDE